MPDLPRHITGRAPAPVGGVVLLFALFSTPALAADLPPPFQATLEVLRNDKVIGEATFAFTTDGEDWVLTSRSEGTKGVAKFIGFEENSESHGDWQNGGPRPLGFRQTYQASFVKRETTADFDWEAGVVDSVHKDGENRLELEPGVLDPASIGLSIRAGLAAGKRAWDLLIVDEDEIESQTYRAAGEEALNTPIGCVVAERVDRIRGPQSTRYTQTWYARDLGWVPVQVAHGKTDGDRMETRLKSLALDGEPVTGLGPCPDG
ncbi:MAG: DUF3108 domain-containing protein [Xanthomonadales bacterium]|jgi:hypothetical protein|nr:DUF3108 domain-containing protein [Xanthomonadales bacterium]